MLFSTLIVGLAVNFVSVDASMCEMSNKTCYFKHRDPVPHLQFYHDLQDGCRTFQCQAGVGVEIHAACNKHTPTDGNCHEAGRRWFDGPDTWLCRAWWKNGVKHFQNRRIAPKFSGCLYQGRQLRHMDIFNTSECVRKQCQNGEIVVFYQGCLHEGECWHFRRILLDDNGKAKQCQWYNATDGSVKFRWVFTPNKHPSKNLANCIYEGITYEHLAIYLNPNQCTKRQCQNGTFINTYQGCKVGDGCRKLGTLFYKPGTRTIMKCVKELSNGVMYYKNKEIHKQGVGCRINEQVLQDLQLYTPPNGCRLRQCQNGKMKFLTQGCYSKRDGQCHQARSIWQNGTSLYKCTTFLEGGWRYYKILTCGRDQEGQCIRPADVIFAIDSSGSISEQDWKRQVTFAAKIVASFNVSGQDHSRFGAVIFSDVVRKLFDLKDYGTHEPIATALVNAGHINKGTKTHLALDFIRNQNMFGTANGGRDNVDKILILMTDGKSNEPQLTLPAANQLKSEGVRIVTIGIGNAENAELKSVSSGPGNWYKAPNFQVLDQLYQQIAIDICEGSDEIEPEPEGEPDSDDGPVEVPTCDSEGSSACDQNCTDNSDGYQCSCRQGYTVSVSDPAKCEDINECMSIFGSPCEQGCVNSVGGYECYCDEGYVPDPNDASKCQDINECSNTWDPPCDQVCTNTPGSYSCSCDPNFVVSPTDPSKCEAVQTCTINTCQHICTSTSTGVQCSCHKGYKVSSSDPARCEDIDECAAGSSCQQKCNNTEGGYMCSCNDGYALNASDPTKCDAIQICNSNADVIILMDGSGSMGFNNWNKQLEFAGRLTEHFNVGSNGVRFGAVAFGKEATKLFDLNQYSNGSAMATAIKSTDYPAAQYTNTHKALDLTDDMFSGANGGRDTSQDIVVILTDGRSSYQSLTMEAADKVKGLGATIISVGVGKTIDQGELERISTSSHDVLHVDSYDAIGVIETSLAKRICQAYNPGQGAVEVSTDESGEDYANVSEGDAVQTCTINTCQHICTSTSTGVQCSCHKGYKVSSSDPARCEDIDECAAGSSCQQKCNNTEGGYVCSCNDGYALNASDPTKCDAIQICNSNADVIILMDGSTSVGIKNWYKQLEFVRRLTELFNVGSNGVRFGAVAFGNGATKLFDLNQYSDGSAMATAIKSTKYPAGTKTETNKALNLTHDMFSSANGGRDTSQDIVVLFTDGVSTFPYWTMKAADKVKRSGATIISVGIGKKINRDRLERISTRSHDVLYVDTYDSIGVTKIPLAKLICQAHNPGQGAAEVSTADESGEDYVEYDLGSGEAGPEAVED